MRFPRSTLRLIPLLFVCLVFWGSWPSAHAEETKIDKTVEVSGVGFVRVVHRVPGEPMMSPDRFEVFVRCHQRKEEKLVESLSICDLKSYDLDSKTKIVSVNFQTGRTDPADGRTYCDVEDYKEIKFAKACKRKKKAASKTDAHH